MRTHQDTCTQVADHSCLLPGPRFGLVLTELADQQRLAGYLEVSMGILFQCYLTKNELLLSWQKRELNYQTLGINPFLYPPLTHRLPTSPRPKLS